MLKEEYGRMLVMAYFNVLFRHQPRETDENHAEFE
jgi:hypothetical protein